ncbi:MAG: ABC transporter permease [Spirochaetaceae bacterium]|jgi:ribose transport system permease protein|nr:ABC transporter permease [Spirochaetaceae bacterium]
MPLLSNKLNSKAMQTVLAFASLILLIVLFALISIKEQYPGGPVYSAFLSGANIVTILQMTAVNGILAVGITFIIITGGIDLSTGTVMTFGSVMAGVCISMLGLPVVIGLLGAVLAGGLCGFVNGASIAKLGLPPFIATLGMLNVTKGLNLIVSKSKPIYFTQIPGFADIATKPILGIPMGVLIFFAAAALAAFILSKTIIGRYCFAIGSNEEAARLSGINTATWKIGIYSMSGAFFGIAGIVMASRLSSAQPALGPGYEMDAIAAAVIGGTSLSGGEGSILGTVIGAFIITVLTNGLRILSVPQEWQLVVTGLIVIGAVYLDIVRRKIR